MVTIQEASQFNTLAYYVITDAITGAPTFAPNTPQEISALPGAWSLLEKNTHSITGQTSVTFVNVTTQEIYIAARGTASIRNLGPDLQIMLGITPTQRNDAALAYHDSVAERFAGYTIQGGGHSLGGQEMAYVSSQRGIDVLIQNAPNTLGTTGAGPFGDSHVAHIKVWNDLIGNWGPDYSNTISVDLGLSTLYQWTDGGTHSIVGLNQFIPHSFDLATQPLGAVDPLAIVGGEYIRHVGWSGASYGEYQPMVENANPDGSFTGTFEDQSTVTVLAEAGGGFTTTSVDPYGETQTTEFDTEGDLIRESWTSINGQHGFTEFFEDGSFHLENYMPDGSMNYFLDWAADGTYHLEHFYPSHSTEDRLADGSLRYEIRNEWGGHWITIDKDGDRYFEYVNWYGPDSGTRIERIFADGSTASEWVNSDGSAGAYYLYVDGGSLAYSKTADGAGSFEERWWTIEDRQFTFAVPVATFANVDPHGTLSYLATRPDGTALPGWLTFDAVTRSFSGLPENDEVGDLEVKVTAMEGSIPVASNTFTLTISNANDAPTVEASIANHVAPESELFVLTLPVNSFVDVDQGDTVTYSVTLADGSELPSWLAFDAATRTFTGTPLSGNVGSVDIKVTAIDGAGASAFDVFTLSVVAAGGGTNGTAAPDNLTGTTGADFINGLGGDDTINGGLGDDAIVGGTGNDSMAGGVGDDSYTVDSAGDVVSEIAGEGTDIVHSFVDWALGANVENLNLTGDGSINGTGNGLNNWIDGNNVANGLNGGDGDDELHGNDGDDTLIGGAGNDVLDGGAGDDAYYVVGSDILSDEGGIDEVFADRNWTLGADFENLTLIGTGNWIAVGNNNGNRITGNAGNNSISGRGGNDTLSGGDGDDVFNVSLGGTSSYGSDTIDGGNGTDVIDWGSNAVSAVTVNLATGTASGGGTAGAGSMTFTNVEDAWGGAFNDTLTGDGGANFLYGAAGNDTLDGGAGADRLEGGSGDDTYTVDDAADVVVELDGGGSNDLVNSSVNHALGAWVNNLTLTGTGAINGTGNELDNQILGNSGANVLTGDDGNDRLEGLDGNDSLIGGNGNDTLYGGTGTDTMVGGLGDDTYGVGSMTDVIAENADEGVDTVSSSVTWTLGANVENLTLTGTDAVNGTGNELGNRTVGNSAANTLAGNGGDDYLDGMAGNDSLLGGEGNDTLVGGAGADTLNGGAGDDAFYVVGGDVLSDSSGVDEVFADRNWTLGADFENLTLVGTGNWTAVGNNSGNRITGNVGNNSISGRGGNDTLSGGDGDDVFNVSLGGTTSYGTDTIDGGNGTDVIDWGSNALSAVTVNLATGTASGGGTAGAGSMTFTNVEDAWGGAHNDTMTGNGGANFLYGAGGNDTLDGGAGADRLEGGSGNDTYQLGRGHGAETVVENDATAGNTDVAKFLTDVARDQIWFQQSGNNLVVSIIGTSDQLTVQDWYVGSQHRVERWETSSGDALLAGQVQNLVDAMASFSPPAPGQYTLPSEYATQLNPVIAANWQ